MTRLALPCVAVLVASCGSGPGGVCTSSEPLGIPSSDVGLSRLQAFGGIGFGLPQPSETVIVESGSADFMLIQRTMNAGRTFYDPVTRPFLVDTTSPSFSIDAVEPPNVHVSALAAGETELVVSGCDGRVAGTATLIEARPIARIRIADSVGYDAPPAGYDLAFAPGYEVTAVLETSETPARRLVDASMTLSLPGSEQLRWDTLRVPMVAPGTYDLQIVAGSIPTSTPVVISEQADSAFAIDPPATIGPTGVTLCFSALYAGRHIAGLDWTWVIDGEMSPGHGPINCRSLYTPKTTGTFVVTASAGGQSATVTMTVQP